MSDRPAYGRGRRTAIPLALAVAGVVLAGHTVALVRPSTGFSFVSDEAPWTLAVLLLPGLVLVGVGVLASGSWPGRRLGVLLALAGMAWFLAEWDSPAAGSATAFSVGLATHAMTPAVIAHVALVYPRGHLYSWASRLIVLTGYLIAVGLVGLGQSLFYEPQTQGCFSCPANLVGVADDPGLAHSMGVLGMRSGLAWTVAAVALASSRLAIASSTARRVTAPVAVPGLVFLGSAGWMFGMSLDRPYLGSTTLDRELWTVQGVALLAMGGGVIWGVLRARRTRRDLAGLVMDLGRLAPAGHLQAALARMLDDPTLVVAYPLGDGRYVDADGGQVTLDAASSSTLTALVRDGRDIAVLLHRPGLLDDPTLVDEIMSAARLGLENERLKAEGLARLADLRASRVRIVESGDEERRRLERDLHDGAQQRLVGLSLGVRLLSRGSGDQTRLTEAAQNLRAAVDELRDLARGLFPVALRDEGLGAALTGLAESAPLVLRELPHARFPAVVETTAYLLVARAAAAGETVATVTAESDHLVVDLESPLTIADLEDLADRVHTLDGSLEEVSPVGADGTRLRARFPASPAG